MGGTIPTPAFPMGKRERGSSSLLPQADLKLFFRIFSNAIHPATLLFALGMSPMGSVHAGIRFKPRPATVVTDLGCKGAAI